MIDTVLVHKGDVFPNYLCDTIHQFYLFNPNSKLVIITDYLFAETTSLLQCYPYLKNIITTSLKKTLAHSIYTKFSLLNRSFRGGFWKYAMERFFVIDDYIRQYNPEGVIHFEYDNTIYFNVEQLYKIFISTGKELAIPQDSPDRCIPSIVFIKGNTILHDFCVEYNLKHLLRRFNDMRSFWRFCSKKIDKTHFLPVLPLSYTKKLNSLQSSSGIRESNPSLYSMFQKEYDGIFDAAAFGQFLGGIDPRNGGTSKPGFVNETAVYSPESFNITWKRDDQNRLIPIIEIDDEKYRLFNLHVHSKNIISFLSDRDQV